MNSDSKFYISVNSYSAEWIRNQHADLSLFASYGMKNPGGSFFLLSPGFCQIPLGSA